MSDRIWMTAEELTEFLSSCPVAAKWIGIPKRSAEAARALDEFVKRRHDARPVAPVPRPATQTPEKDNTAMDQRPPFLRNFDTFTDVWAWGRTESGSVFYLRVGEVGRDAAVLALAAQGCNRIGAAVTASEAALVAKFGKLGWPVAGRLLDCESVVGAVRLGYLKKGRLDRGHHRLRTG